MTAVDVAAIRARCEAATPGPWAATPPHPDMSPGSFVGNYWSVGTPGDGYLERFTADVADHLNAHADAEFVAHARTDVPALLSALEAAVSRAEVAETALARLLIDIDFIAADLLKCDRNPKTPDRVANLAANTRNNLLSCAQPARAAVRGDAT